MLRQIIKIANHLDQLGYAKEATKLDAIAIKLASWGGDWRLDDLADEQERRSLKGLVEQLSNRYIEDDVSLRDDQWELPEEALDIEAPFDPDAEKYEDSPKNDLKLPHSTESIEFKEFVEEPTFGLLTQEAMGAEQDGDFEMAIRLWNQAAAQANTPEQRDRASERANMARNTMVGGSDDWQDLYASNKYSIVKKSSTGLLNQALK